MRFVIPQFIDTEPKIFGPVSVRQFVILLVGGIFVYIFFRLLSFVWFLPVGLFLIGSSAVIAFARVNGQPFHYFLLNVADTFKNPKLQVWRREYHPEDFTVKEKVHVKTLAPKRKKTPLTSSHLAELSLIVDTGGIYHPDLDTQPILRIHG